MRKRVSIRWLFILVLFVICVIYVLNVLQTRHSNNRRPLRNKYTIETIGCRIPHLDLYDEAIVRVINKSVKGYTCVTDKRPIVLSNATSLFFDPASFADYGVAGASELDCGYLPFWRVDPTKDSEDDTDVRFGKRKRIVSDVRVDEDFVRVDCKPTGGGGMMFVEFYSFVPSNKWNKFAKNDRLWNVAILGIDSLSRMHVQRTMPNTVRALRQIGAIEMLGYNKVEDNTFPNIVPLIAGMSWKELIKNCWPSYQTRFDKCWFVFNDFRRSGYLTSWAEERSDFGIFNYLKKGWTHQPVDIYWNTFEEIARRQIGHIYKFNYPDCIGSRPAFDAALDHTERLISGGVAAERPFFTFTWLTTLAHNNYDTAALGDDSIASLVTKLESNRLLDRTILLVMSDHGFRWGALSRTHQGHLEDRLPFMFWRLPPDFVAKYPEKAKNLSENSKRLVTTFDVFATLHDILDNDVNKTARSVSLFTPIPQTRTCDSADIPAHYCTCFEPVPVDVGDSDVKRVSDFLVRHINELLAGHECSEMHLGGIKTAELIAAGDLYSNVKLSTRDFTVTLSIDPNSILVSGTVRVLDDDMQVAGTVSRLDWYGNQSHCVSDPTLKLYCQCLS